MESKYTETIKTWNKVAKLYEDKFMDLELYNDSYQKFCELLINEKPSVLEIGCGPGNITKQLLNLKPQLSILATDVSENMVALAKKNNPTTRTQLLDIPSLSDLNESFDDIICGFTIPYLSKDDLEKLWNEFYFKLNKKGIIYLSFVDGDYTNSGFQTSSSGDRVYFHYYKPKFISQLLVNHNFVLLKELSIQYKKSDGAIEIHSILIAQKAS
ncbi:class I SAM-dependent DNA methyltransferase [Tenacibaculum sp. MEBiC06402]|uniref:class I SAM-dependent DNA methyltransferase n=1 Tax=unclassified Tenacibaculum TaxID=2635139 RepID=UPI003B9AD372